MFQRMIWKPDPLQPTQQTHKCCICGTWCNPFSGPNCNCWEKALDLGYLSDELEEGE